MEREKDLDKFLKQVAIVTRAKDESEGLFELVEALAEQSFRDFEFILVYSSLKKSSVEILLANFETIKFIQIKENEYSSAGALNKGFEEANSEIIVSLNGDAIPAGNEWLSLLIEPILINSNIVGTFGRQIPKAEAIPQEIKDLENTYPKNMDEVDKDLFSAVNAAFRKSAWESHNFDEKTIVAEDIEWAKWMTELDCTIKYIPEAAVYHSHNTTLKQKYNRSFSEGRGLYYIYRTKIPLIVFIWRYSRNILSDCRYFIRYFKFSAILYSIIYRLFMQWGYFKGNEFGAKNLIQNGNKSNIIKDSC